MNHIDKEIYKQPEVSKRLHHLSIWYWITALVGIVCTLLTILLPNVSGAVSALLLMGLVIGDFILLLVLCYYPFGDSRGAYYKGTKQFLTRETDYYPRNAKQTLLDALESDGMEAIAAIKKGVVPDLELIRYVDDNHSVAYCQLLEIQGGKERPLTEVVKK